MNMWGGVRWVFRRCPAWRVMPAPDNWGLPLRIYCEKGRPHWGLHESFTFNRSWV